MLKATSKKPVDWREQFKRDIERWKGVPFEERTNDPEYLEFEAARSALDRKQRGAKVAVESAVALLKQKEKISSELKAPWDKRERNQGPANKIFWRPFGLALDVAALPFFAGSWLLSRIARPVSWVNDILLNNPSARQGPAYRELSKKDKKNRPRTILQKGTTLRKDFFPSILTERRKLARIQGQLDAMPADIRAMTIERIKSEKAEAKKAAA